MEVGFVTGGSALDANMWLGELCLFSSAGLTTTTFGDAELRLSDPLLADTVVDG